MLFKKSKMEMSAWVSCRKETEKGNKIMRKVMLWRYGIDVNVWPTCWSRGALINQSLSVCGIPGVAGKRGSRDSRNILHGDAAPPQGENP